MEDDTLDEPLSEFTTDNDISGVNVRDTWGEPDELIEEL